MTPDMLRKKLAKLDRVALAEFVFGLAKEDPKLRPRIETFAQGGDLSSVAASLEKRLRRFRNGRSFISYGESGSVARELGAWLDDVEKRILPADAETAWKLFDQFVRMDERVIDRADDSNGTIGNAFVRGCGLWLRAAAALPAGPEWVERLHELHAGNGYGTRDTLLNGAATLLSEPDLRRLAAIFEQEAKSAPRGDDKKWRLLSASTAMGQVAVALGDAALHERSVRLLSPRPNELQAAHIAQAYVQFGPAERAVEWLAPLGETGRDEIVIERLDLLAQAYEKLGDREAQRESRRRIAERVLRPECFLAYAELLPPDERAAARERAIERAERSDDPVDAAGFLLELGEDDRAAALVLRRSERLPAAFYEPLSALAEDFENAGQPLAAIACYRALVDQILGAGRSTAYRHAKRYVDRLAGIDARVKDPSGLPSHAEYVARLRQEHARKYGFWGLFAA